LSYYTLKVGQGKLFYFTSCFIFLYILKFKNRMN